MTDLQREIDYKQVLDAMFDDLAIVDENGIMIYVTNGFERQYNIKREDVLGKSIEEIEKNLVFNPSVAKKVFQQNKKVIMSHKNKKGNYVIVNGIPVHDADGRHIKYVVSYAPTSEEIDSLQQERNRLQEKLEEYQQKLADLQDKFDTLNQGNTLKSAGSIMEKINKIKEYDVSVLLTGESGVGKTTYARYLHKNGQRKDGPFVEISCGAIPENLLESELFGYKKGSFTGANQEGKVGLIETANHGTLFLDEIAELPLKLQAKLLKVLQEKTIMKVGDTREIEVDFRLITATNKDLKQMVKAGTFREDLFYRINVVTIEIPPLRKRNDDIVTLAQYFTDKFNLKYGAKKKLPKECIQVLCDYPWPGNIREMENMIERLIILSDGETIAKQDLQDLLPSDMSLPDHELSLGDQTLEEMISSYEREIFVQAVNTYRTSVKVAEVLGISQSTAARKIREYVKANQ